MRRFVCEPPACDEQKSGHGEKLDENELISIRADNSERYSKIVQWLGGDLIPGLNIDYDVLRDPGVSAKRKMELIRASIRGSMKQYFQMVAQIHGHTMSDNELEEACNAVCQCCDSMFDNYQIGVHNEDKIDVLVDKIRCLIDDNTFDGGISRSSIRRQIGRNKTEDTAMVDEALARLLETGDYIKQQDYYYASLGGRVPKPHHRGRPKQYEEITQRVHGRLDKYVPIPREEDDQT